MPRTRYFPMCRHGYRFALLALGVAAPQLSGETAIKLPPDGPSVVVPYPQPQPIRLSALGGWIFIKLPRPQYEPLAASPNGIVLLRDPVADKFMRWKAGVTLPLGPESTDSRMTAISDSTANQGTHIFLNYALSATGSIALGYGYSSVTPASSVWDQYVRVWSSRDEVAKIAQGQMFSSLAFDGGAGPLVSTNYYRHSGLLGVNTIESTGADYVIGLFSRHPNPPPAEDPILNTADHRLLTSTAPYTVPDMTTWYGTDFELVAINSRGQHIAKRIPGGGSPSAGVVQYQNVPFAPVYISENGVVLGRNGISNFYALGNGEGADVMYTNATGNIPLPTDGRVTWVDELDRPNGFAPNGTPVVWTPKRGPDGIASPSLGYDRETYIPLPSPEEGWVTNPVHMIPPNTIKHQLGILRKGTQTQPFLAIRGGLFVDGNRDGIIELDDSERTSAANPYRFWVNDDDDVGDEANQTAFGGNSDEPGKLSGWFEFDGRTPDHAKAGVDGRCDLLDFFPVYLDIKQLLTVLPHTTEGVAYKLKQASGALNFVYTDLTRDHAFDYLTKEAAVYGTNLNKLPHLAETSAITSGGVVLSATFLDKIRSGTGKGIILIEGSKASDSPLILEVFKDGQSIVQTQVYIKISEVEKMYRWINLRGVAGQSITRPTNITQPENYPDSATNGKMFIFVHGYNVNEQQSRAWNAEAFKRMYQSGSRAMFTAVSWHGDYSQIPLVGVSPDYWENITLSFRTAQALPAAINTLPGSSKIIAGHSMGNVVVSSAIKDQSPALSVTKYFMLDAAVALEAYDISTLQVEAMRHPDWASYNQRGWSTQWYDLFPTGDGRRGLTWLNRFGDISNAINFYSSGEEVLNNNDAASGGTPGQVPTGIFGAERKWVLQEMVKGTQHIGAVLTFSSQGGWGFNGAWDIAKTTTTGGPHGGTTTTYRHRTPAEADQLTSDQLKATPLFRGFQNTAILGTNGGGTASEYLVRAAALGTAIPALSFPAGRNPIPLFVNQNRNTDLMDRQDGWPQARLNNDTLKNRWIHSDAKNIAYRYNHKLWEDWVDRADLK